MGYRWRLATEHRKPIVTEANWITGLYGILTKSLGRFASTVDRFFQFLNFNILSHYFLHSWLMDDLTVKRIERLFSFLQSRADFLAFPSGSTPSTEPAKQQLRRLASMSVSNAEQMLTLVRKAFSSLLVGETIYGISML